MTNKHRNLLRILIKIQSFWSGEMGEIFQIKNETIVKISGHWSARLSVCPSISRKTWAREHESSMREREKGHSRWKFCPLCCVWSLKMPLSHWLTSTTNEERSDFSVRSLRQKSEVLFFFVSLLLRRRRWRLFGWLVSSANSFCLCSFFQLHRLARGERQKSPTSTTGHSAWNDETNWKKEKKRQLPGALKPMNRKNA